MSAVHLPYRLDDLDRLSDEFGARVEITEEGLIVVSPAADPHVFAVSQLLGILGPIARRLDLVAVAEGPRWAPVGGTVPLYVPDLAVVARAALRRPPDNTALDPPPLLVVEVSSRSTRRTDRGEKADAYFRGGAQSYWLVDTTEVGVTVPTLETRERGSDAWTVTGVQTGAVEVPVAGEVVSIDLRDLVI
jgi:Uma2 family endonuclease